MGCCFIRNIFPWQLQKALIKLSPKAPATTTTHASYFAILFHKSTQQLSPQHTLLHIFGRVKIRPIHQFSFHLNSHIFVFALTTCKFYLVKNEGYLKSTKKNSRHITKIVWIRAHYHRVNLFSGCKFTQFLLS